MNYLAKELETHAKITPRQRHYWVEQGLLQKDPRVGVHFRTYTEWMMFRAALIAHIIRHTPISKCMAQTFINMFESTINTDLLDGKDFIEDLTLMLIFDRRAHVYNKKTERCYDLIIMGPRSAWAPMIQKKVYVFKLAMFWPTEISVFDI